MTFRLAGPIWPELQGAEVSICPPVEFNVSPLDRLVCVKIIDQGLRERLGLPKHVRVPPNCIAQDAPGCPRIDAESPKPQPDES